MSQNSGPKPQCVLCPALGCSRDDRVLQPGLEEAQTAGQQADMEDYDGGRLGTLEAREQVPHPNQRTWGSSSELLSSQHAVWTSRLYVKLLVFIYWPLILVLKV